VTPEEYRALLAAAATDIAKAAQEAYNLLLKLADSGVPITDAIKQVTEQFSNRFREIFASALSQITGEVVTAATVATYQAGNITLSSRLYSNSVQTSTIVESTVNRHIRGYQDARALALELYEGYGFKTEEILKLSPSNEVLPKYLREAVLVDSQSRNELQRAFDKARARVLRTAPLRAAYNELLTAIEKVEDGAGKKHLENKVRVAYEEKTRYFAKRIAETELARAYSIETAREIMADDDVKYVQWMLSPAHPVEDICDYFAGVDKHGLGRGVYPKHLAPTPPAHPFCKCVQVKRFDLNHLEPKPKEGAQESFFSRLQPDIQRRVAGSEAKLNRVKGGEDALSVHNASIDPLYQVKPAGSV
jgi:hypothetical protein